jgi:hypothetical protein
MCDLVFVGLPESASALTQGLVAADFHVAESSNPSVRALFPRGHSVWVVTRGGCSCGVYWQPPKFDESAQRRKYRTKGWSEPKIERAILGKRPSPQPASAAFNAAFAAMVCEAGVVQLLTHTFRGTIETEPLPPCGH